MKRKVSWSEIIGGYINVKVNIKYWLQFRIGKFSKRIGYQYINRSLNSMEYNILMTELYGNKYLQNKYTENEEQILNSKRWLAGIVDTYLNPEKAKLSMCDAGANKGYLMKAFRELGYDCYGFDILEDTSEIIDYEKDHYLLGSILQIPKFDKSFDIVTCTNVFEHIPINFIDTMAAELLKLSPKYFVFEISVDAMSDGHITLKGKRFWLKKFPGYRIMAELTGELKQELSLNGEHYQYTGVPRNKWNSVPGIIFMERL